MHVCVYVRPHPEAINYVHVILNLFIKVSFLHFKMQQTTLYMDVALRTKFIVKETKL